MNFFELNNFLNFYLNELNPLEYTIYQSTMVQIHFIILHLHKILQHVKDLIIEEKYSHFLNHDNLFINLKNLTLLEKKETFLQILVILSFLIPF